MNPFQPGARGGWPVPLEGLTVNGTAIPISANQTGVTKFTPPNSTQGGGAVEALVVTADAAIYAPPEVVKAVYAAIPGAAPVPATNNPRNTTWQFPCNSTGMDVRLKIGGHEYAIQARDMVVGLLGDNLADGVSSSGATPDSGMCLGAIMT